MSELGKALNALEAAGRADDLVAWRAALRSGLVILVERARQGLAEAERQRAVAARCLADAERQLAGHDEDAA
jgi:hypothetical protein